MILITENIVPVNYFVKEKIPAMNENAKHSCRYNVKFSNLYKIIGNQHVSLKYLKYTSTPQYEKIRIFRQKATEFATPFRTGINREQPYGQGNRQGVNGAAPFSANYVGRCKRNIGSIPRTNYNC